MLLAQEQVVVNTDNYDEVVRELEGLGYSVQSSTANQSFQLEKEWIWKQIIVTGGDRLRALVALIAGIILIILDYWGPRLFQVNGEINRPGQLFWLGMAVITLAVMFFSGKNIYRAALSHLKYLSFTMDTLIFIGTFAAWIFSSLVIAMPHLIPSAATHLYLDAAVMILAFINFGHSLESRGKAQALKAIEALLDLSPQRAIRVSNLSDLEGESESITVEQVKLGDILKVKPGAQVPVDGVVIAGESYLDESMMTGEPLAVYKQAGDSVMAGSLNQMGSLLFKALAIGEDTMLAKMMQAVQEAHSMKPKIGRLADKISSIFVPMVMLMAVLTAIVWALLAPEPRISFVLATSIAVLVIACPCALGLAAPMGVIAGVGRAAGLGILIRHADALQRSGRITHVILDKTGTITEDQPELRCTLSLDDGINDLQLLQLAASLERDSEHPLAQAILHAANKDALELFKVTGFKAIAGQGLMGQIQGKKLYIGNQRLMVKLGLSADLEQINQQRLHGMSVLYLAQETRLLGAFGVMDRMRKDSAEAIKRLQDLGLTVMMLTGDRLESATLIADTVGITEVIGDVLPEQKQAKVKQLQAQGHVVAMVGDGVNDAPALAQADVSLAMGAGSDIAIAAADITLLRHSIHGVADAIRISQLTMRNIKQNLSGAMIYNSLGIPVAAGVFYPVFHLLLHPMVASLAMALSSVTVVGNALRLRYLKL
ncbi:Copper-exporting P-type ATPase A [Piscirickettsia salmonis]|uniref:copper-translocating P-type ATPase n=1 Tax=Piscirickettsia salmonis TaxID=1238 RepID=UPI001E5D167D|nr:copper-translocating P-type ATPase [Piscirickettsia salmonis]QGP55867.1 Copper-exporting P-type ATPase A [Piscirickettsia salmonis]QGP65436.1 Copper-exporting P-type ATPase A [Piscirickettsia salmonis]